ncbi:MAG: hypothetical protein GWN44_07720, partial [Calditrichae bacterium]|nr:hypothetical protein [Calditrichia bacterium]
RGDVFCAVYEWREEELQKVTEDTLIAIENLAEVIPSHALILGADARKLRSQLEPVLPDGGLFYNPSPTSPQIWSLLELGLQKFQQGLVSDIKECEPFYMRAFKGVS